MFSMEASSCPRRTEKTTQSLRRGNNSFHGVTHSKCPFITEATEHQLTRGRGALGGRREVKAGLFLAPLTWTRSEFVPEVNHIRLWMFPRCAAVELFQQRNRLESDAHRHPQTRLEASGCDVIYSYLVCSSQKPSQAQNRSAGRVSGPKLITLTFLPSLFGI